MSTIKLVVGLGNPGGEYENTRHNVGFMTADALAGRRGLSWKKWSGAALTAGPISPDLPVLLVKPQNFMNRSGLAVRELVQYYRLQPQEVLAVFDDFALPLGTLRIRLSGSAGGHNGVASLIENLGTNAFPRLRLGIGPLPPHQEAADFVLSRFSGQERAAVGDMVTAAAEAVESILERGMDKAASLLGESQKTKRGE